MLVPYPRNELSLLQTILHEFPVHGEIQSRESAIGFTNIKFDIEDNILLILIQIHGRVRNRTATATNTTVRISGFRRILDLTA